MKYETVHGDVYVEKSRYSNKRTNITIKDNGNWVTASIEELSHRDLWHIRDMIDQRIDELKQYCKHEEIVEDVNVKYCSLCGLIFQFKGAVKWDDIPDGYKKIKFDF